MKEFIVFEEAELGALREMIIEALFTDGAHHKQWYLEQILAVVLQATGEDVEDVLEDCERGIAP